MKVTWTVEGADWKSSFQEDISSSPMEIATKAIERALNSLPEPQDEILGKEISLDFGMILMVSHDKMESIDNTFICYTPTILANAGFHNEATELQKAIDRLTKMH